MVNIACLAILAQINALSASIALLNWSMANAHVQTRLSLMPIHNHACNAMSHALHVQSLVNAIHVQMALLLEIISALLVSQTNT